jgi:hypothetical protein
MLFGGAFFDPTRRSARRTSIGAFLSNAGILIGGFAILASVFLPWVHGVLADPTSTPPNGLAAIGALGWLLVIIGGTLLAGALANALSHSRPFNLGLQVFATVAGIAVLLSHPFMRPCFVPPVEGTQLHIGLPPQFGPGCPWTGNGLGAGYYLVRTGAAITVASAILALAISGFATVIWRRRAPVIA